MPRPEVIRKRLGKLNEYLSLLEKMREYSLQDFVSEPERYGSTERFLQLAVEAALDIANHVIAELELGTVNQGRDIPMLFKDNGYIDGEMEEQWVRMIGFRNILVHDYLDVDRRIVYQVLQQNLDDLRALEKVFAQFL